MNEIPAHVRSVLIFGGTFDPPHLGHIVLPAIAREKLGIDWVLYIPAASPPLKRGPIASEQQRLDMLVCALQDSQYTSISTIEYTRGGTSYTIDTLEALGAQYPDISLRLLIGADQVSQFHRWRQAHNIIVLAEPVVMLRDSLDSQEALKENLQPHWTDNELQQWIERAAPVPAVDCNSTKIRILLSSPQGHKKELMKCLPGPLYNKIILANLYG